MANIGFYRLHERYCRMSEHRRRGLAAGRVLASSQSAKLVGWGRVTAVVGSIPHMPRIYYLVANPYIQQESTFWQHKLPRSGNRASTNRRDVRNVEI